MGRGGSHLGIQGIGRKDGVRARLVFSMHTAGCMRRQRTPKAGTAGHVHTSPTIHAPDGSWKSVATLVMLIFCVSVSMTNRSALPGLLTIS